MKTQKCFFGFSPFFLILLIAFGVTALALGAEMEVEVIAYSYKIR